ncbi:MAG: Dna2/Cas4 domain-containing protein [Victivallaceae bacterium]|nr:Dna2/Cas4 domain-containing protein [Victivallaceae bacterium]
MRTKITLPEYICKQETQHYSRVLPPTNVVWIFFSEKPSHHSRGTEAVHNRLDTRHLNRDAVQMCAQALCLEEMMKFTIDKAWLFYFETRTRMEICVTEKLRLECASAITACHDLLESGVTPAGTYSAKSRACSMQEYCMPPRKRRTYGDDFREMLS